MKILRLQLSVNQYFCFGICLLLMLIIPIVHYHKIVGIDLGEKGEETPPVMTETSDGTLVINTTEIGKDIIGYGGPTPVEIYIKDGKIEKIKALPNQETPEFYGAVRNSDILESLDGMTLQEASGAKIDAVSGATYSSAAVINNIKTGINYALDESHQPVSTPSDSQPLDLKWYAALLIILSGAIVPLFIRNIRYRYVQLALNVAVLGFWGGTFISYSIMVSALTNGLWRVILIPVALMLVTAFIYPMFGKVNHYCNWLCPYGSLQELAGKCCKWKIKITPRAAGYLTKFREILWFGLMWLLWTGIWFDWMGYEPFAAFFFNDSSWVVLAIAGAFIILSLFVQRPYCRFVCPTGSLFKFSEGG